MARVLYVAVGRCAACHSPDNNQKQVKDHGEQVSWIKLRDPEGTLKYMLEAKLIDTYEPERSLLLMKPTMQMEHGGGQKMVVGDRTYKQFRRFIDDYAAIMQGKYVEVEQLPEPNKEVSVVTDIWLKIEDVPAKYHKMLLQTDLYRQSDSGWSEFRWRAPAAQFSGRRTSGSTPSVLLLNEVRSGPSRSAPNASPPAGIY